MIVITLLLVAGFAFPIVASMMFQASQEAKRIEELKLARKGLSFEEAYESFMDNLFEVK